MPASTLPDPVAAAALLDHFGHKFTELVGAIRGLITNDVLAVETVIIPANGVVTRSFSAPFGSVAVTNNTGALVTLISGPDTLGAAPTSGAGVCLVPNGHSVAYSIAGYALTIYGTAGQAVTLQVFDKPQPPAWG